MGLPLFITALAAAALANLQCSEPPLMKKRNVEVVRTIPKEKVYRDSQKKKNHKKAIKLRKHKGHKHGGGRK